MGKPAHASVDNAVGKTRPVTSIHFHPSVLGSIYVFDHGWHL